MADPVIVRGMLRTTKLSPEEKVAQGVAGHDQVIADCRSIAARAAEVAASFERLAAACDDQERAKRYEYLARGLHHTSEGILGEVEDL